MKNYLYLLLFFSLSCQNDLTLTGESVIQIKGALIEIDSFYRSDRSNVLNISEQQREVHRISKEHGVRIAPLTLSQFVQFRANTTNNANAIITCSGTPTSIEIVDEGNGCFGLVRIYANGSSSISAYCRNNSGTLYYDGYYCYQ